jgi:Family of unknown function (DUF6527)
VTAFPIIWVTDGYILDEDKRVLHGDSEQWCRSDLPNGSASWSLNTKDEVVGLLFVCPCGCGVVGSLSIVPGYGGPVWRLANDDYDLPTLKPSIQKTSPCRWHGFIERGWWCNNRNEVPR